jgi:MFS family permease
MMTADTPLWIISAVLFVNGVGMGLWNVPNNSVILGAVPRSRYGVVSALTNLTRNVGNVTGQAFTAAVVVGVMASNGFDIPLSEIVGTEGAGDAFLRGWQIAYWAVAAFTVAGALLAFLTRPPSDGSEEIADTADPIPSGR